MVVVSNSVYNTLSFVFLPIYFHFTKVQISIIEVKVFFLYYFIEKPMKFKKKNQGIVNII